MAFPEIAYQLVFGIPIVRIFGFLAFFCLIVTSLIPILTMRRIVRVPMKWHHYLAGVTVLFAAIHILLVL